MLTKEQAYILSLLRESLNTKQSSLSELVDKQTVVDIILRNSILLTVYHKLPDDLKTQLKSKYSSNVSQSVVQEYEGERVLKALGDIGLKCIPLKGWELRKLYPDSTMRQMADLDILVQPYIFGQIKNEMEKLGFTGGSENNWKHNSFMKKTIHVEMHKRLTDDSRLIQTWENGLWDRATAVEGNICNMSPEDFYIFHFVHLHKDFLNGSLGLRRIVDTWLLQKRSDVDMKQVEYWLESFRMWKFHEQMVKLSRVTMGELPMDEEMEVLLKHAFAHGIYGSGKSYKAGRIAAMGSSLKGGKVKSIVSAVFLPYGRMKAQFPVLERFPVLLPYCWGKRILRMMKGNKEKYRKMLDYSDVSKADYKEMKRIFEAGGVY